jgi:hypothetical protein
MIYQISNTKVLTIKNYLSTNHRDNLWSHFMSNQKQFAGIASLDYKEDIMTLFDEKVFNLFAQRFDDLDLKKFLKDNFNYVFEWEKIFKLNPKTEIIKTIYLNDGVTINEHLDDLDENNLPTQDKRINLMYSVFKKPKSFTGGDFIIRDRYVDQNNNFLADKYPKEGTKIELQDNCLTIFDSAYPHQLTEIINQSKSFENSLFIVFMQAF